jgi:hypothetical protein
MWNPVGYLMTFEYQYTPKDVNDGLNEHPLCNDIGSLLHRRSLYMNIPGALAGIQPFDLK